MAIWKKRQHSVAHRLWTPEELDQLRAGGPVPTRSEMQCRCKANSLGITYRTPTSNRWTADEVDMVRNGVVPPGRTESAMIAYCLQHRIPVPKKETVKHYMSEDEERLILSDVVPDGYTVRECRRYASSNFNRGFKPLFKKLKDSRMERGRKIVEMRDTEKMSFPDIAKAFGLSKQRVHQLYNFYVKELEVCNGN